MHKWFRPVKGVWQAKLIRHVFTKQTTSLAHPVLVCFLGRAKHDFSSCVTSTSFPDDQIAKYMLKSDVAVFLCQSGIPCDTGACFDSCRNVKKGGSLLILWLFRLQLKLNSPWISVACSETHLLFHSSKKKLVLVNFTFLVGSFSIFLLFIWVCTQKCNLAFIASSFFSHVFFPSLKRKVFK